MNVVPRVRTEFLTAAEDFNSTPAMQRITAGRIGLSHYKEFLVQVYHYTRDSALTQAAMVLRLRGSDRAMAGTFLKHAVQEVGHDQLALADLKALGEDTGDVPFCYPHPATEALRAYGRGLLHETSPVSYLGWLYFLENLPTSQGASLMSLLSSKGIPMNAMSFLSEHAAVDVHHNKLMDRYLESFVQTEIDFAAVVYAMHVTGFLYAGMLQGALDQGDRPKDWGRDIAEEQRSNTSLGGAMAPNTGTSNAA